jgi:hypothetical protein
VSLALLLSVALRLWAQYDDLCDKLHLARFIALPQAEHSRIVPLLRLTAASGPPRVITLVIRAKAGDIPLEPLRDGTLALPLRKALFDENPPVLTSLPAGLKTKVTLDLRPLLPEGTSFAYADLFLAVTQANRYAEAEAGFFKFMVPRMKGLVLRFAGAQTVQVQVGDETLRAGEDGTLRLLVDDELMKSNPAVTLGAVPSGADFAE